MIVRDWYRLFKVYINIHNAIYILKALHELIIRLLEVVGEERVRLDRTRIQIINKVLHIMTQIQHRVR